MSSLSCVAQTCPFSRRSPSLTPSLRPSIHSRRKWADGASAGARDVACRRGHAECDRAGICRASRRHCRYFRALTAYRAGDVRPIIETLSESAFAAVQNGRTLEKDITRVAASWDTTVRARRDSSIHALKGLLLRQPVVTIKIVARECHVSEQAADSSVMKLVDAGILTQVTAGRRNRHWEATEILTALDDFGARARRRRGGS
jgi:hypothetical protein